MPLTNFPNGVSSFGIPVVGSGPIIPAGNVFFVSSVSGGLGDGTSKDFPLATLSAALARCTANNGDVIFLLPGHAETISSATALTVSTAGVSIIGLGKGTKRAQFTLDTANTATINVTANNVSFSNIAFVGNFLSIASLFTLTTAKYFTVDTCDIADTSSVLGFLAIITTGGTTADCDGLTFSNNKVSMLSTSATSIILLVGTNDRVTITGNFAKMAVNNDKAIFVKVTAAKIVTNFVATNNIGIRLNTTTAGGSFIDVGGTTSTGVVADNRVQTATTTTDLLFTTSVGLSAFNNLVSGVVGASGFLIPAADS